MPKTRPSRENEWQLPQTGRPVRMIGGGLEAVTAPKRHARRDGSLTASAKGRIASRSSRLPVTGSGLVLKVVRAQDPVPSRMIRLAERPYWLISRQMRSSGCQSCPARMTWMA
jgi:hypothetical protein